MKILQTSSRESERRWKWSISLDASQPELDAIEKVIYHLHPTFRNPIVEKTNRSENFELKTSGWGTFVVHIEIHYKDGGIEELRHRLEFEHEKPKVFLSYSESQTDPAIVEAVRNEASQLGWDITSTEAINPGEDWEYSLNKQIDEAQLFVLIGGETPSRGVLEEVETAQQLGKKVLAYDAGDIYGMQDMQKAMNSDDLVNAFKAYDVELKGV
jgi:transcription initiation factor IIF auxiliary subunit